VPLPVHPVARLLSPEPLGLARTGVGLAMLVRPGLVPALLGVRGPGPAAMAWAMQMLGAREIAIGLGGAAAARQGDPQVARAWLAAGILCDAVDALAVANAVGRGRLRPGPGGALVAVAAAATALQAAALGRR